MNQKALRTYMRRGWSQKKIADHLGCTVAAIRTRIYLLRRAGELR